MNGIMFTKDLFRSILAGKKTQTRRAVKLPRWANRDSEYRDIKDFEEGGGCVEGGLYVVDKTKHFRQIKPLYKEGKVIYLKEPYAYFYYSQTDRKVLYRFAGNRSDAGWKNKMFMSADDARYFIKVLKVRHERLKAISPLEIKKEGLELPTTIRSVEQQLVWLRDSWIELWNGINDRVPFDWDSNPWVWVYDFALCDRKGNLFDSIDSRRIAMMAS